MLTQAKVMLLCEVDNTLLDNARFAANLTARLDDDSGSSKLELRHDGSTNTLIHRFYQLRSPGS